MEQMEQQAEILIHFFLINDNCDIYRIGIEGDKELAREYLESINGDVRFEKSCEKLGWEKGNKVLPNGCIIRSCQFAYSLTKKKQEKNSIFAPVVLPDPRHTVIGGCK